jgi:hypothetical protein
MTTTIEGTVFYGLVLVFDLWLVLKAVGKEKGPDVTGPQKGGQLCHRSPVKKLHRFLR